MAHFMLFFKKKSMEFSIALAEACNEWISSLSA